MMPKQCRLAEFYKKSENPPDESLMVTFVTQSITSECDNFLNKIADLRTEADDKGVPLTWDKLLKSLETKANVKHQAPKEGTSSSKRNANHTDGKRRGGRGGGRGTGNTGTTMSFLNSAPRTPSATCDVRSPRRTILTRLAVSTWGLFRSQNTLWQTLTFDGVFGLPQLQATHHYKDATHEFCRQKMKKKRNFGLHGVERLIDFFSQK